MEKGEGVTEAKDSPDTVLCYVCYPLHRMLLYVLPYRWKNQIYLSTKFADDCFSVTKVVRGMG